MFSIGEIGGIEIQFEEKCQICDGVESLVDTWEEDSCHIHEKLEAITQNQESWLRFICTTCKDKLDDLWEFRGLCKDACEKYLVEMQEITAKLNSNEEIVAEKVVTIKHRNQIDKEIKGIQGFEGEPAEENIPTETNYFVEDIIEIDVPIIHKLESDDYIELREITGESTEETVKPGVTCSICNKTYTTKSQLTQHINIIHKKITPYQCSYCGKKFATRYRIEQHQEIHIKNRTKIPCDYCDQTFTSQSNKRRHIIEVHENSSKRKSNKSVCKICEVAFDTKMEYYEHMDSHPGVRIRRLGLDLKCSFCCKGFRSYQAVKAHERIHTGDKPFKCEICSKDFRQESHLNTHMNKHMKHTGERRHACDYCDKEFSDRNARKVHERIHTGEMPYACQNCPERFRGWKVWKNHMKTCCSS